MCKRDRLPEWLGQLFQEALATTGGRAAEERPQIRFIPGATPDVRSTLGVRFSATGFVLPDLSRYERRQWDIRRTPSQGIIVVPRWQQALESFGFQRYDEPLWSTVVLRLMRSASGRSEQGRGVPRVRRG